LVDARIAVSVFYGFFPAVLLRSARRGASELPGRPTVERNIHGGFGRSARTFLVHETDGVTKLAMKLAFRDKAGRDHMTKSDGQEDSFNKMEDYLRSLLDQKATASG
jgi:hypothetical protein